MKPQLSGPPMLIFILKCLVRDLGSFIYIYLYSPRRFFSSLVNFSMANIFNILHLKIKYVSQGPILYPLSYSVLKRNMKEVEETLVKLIAYE